MLHVDYSNCIILIFKACGRKISVEVRRWRGVVAFWRVRRKSVWKEKNDIRAKKKRSALAKHFILCTFRCRNISAYKYTFM